MIVLDANILIALLDANDAHHTATLDLLELHAADGYAASTLTVAEALVHPVMAHRQDHAINALTDIGLTVLPLTGDDVLDLARVRAQYRVRMPDAVTLHAAVATHSGLATFDSALANAARQAGVTVAAATAPPA